MKLSTSHKFFSATAAVSVLLLTAACGGNSSDGSANPASSTSATTDGGSSSSASFKDGTYDAKASYPNPAGSSNVEVKVTLASGKITKVTVTPEAENPTSKGFQTQFAGGISDVVVGKSIASLKVSTVAGSSLTSLGFNKAIDTIKADAKA
jgi:uncharacterized protein with FMN-binding domain